MALTRMSALGIVDVFMFHCVHGALELVDMLQGLEEISKAVAQVKKDSDLLTTSQTAVHGAGSNSL